MTIIRTVIAQCDRSGCTETLVLDPNNTQPFIAIEEAGWSVVVDDKLYDNVATICPRDHDAACTSLLDEDGDWWVEFAPDRFYVATIGGWATPAVTDGVPADKLGVDLVHLFTSGVSSEPY